MIKIEEPFQFLGGLFTFRAISTDDDFANC